MGFQRAPLLRAHHGGQPVRGGAGGGDDDGPLWRHLLCTSALAQVDAATRNMFTSFL